MFNVFRVIPSFGEFNDSVDETKGSGRPQISGNALYHLLRESLDPRSNNMLLVHREMHSDLQRKNEKCFVRKSLLVFVFKIDKNPRKVRTLTIVGEGWLTSASAGLFFFHHLVMARPISRFGFRRGAVREMAPIIDMAESFSNWQREGNTSKVCCSVGRASRQQQQGADDLQVARFPLVEIPFRTMTLNPYSYVTFCKSRNLIPWKTHAWLIP